MAGRYFNSNTPLTVVVGGIIGTGVFVSLGYQLEEFHSPFVLLSLWVVGGVASLCGAMTYCELASVYPKSGGEYNFLREVFHPSVGFVAGWISTIVGFSAPSALVAMTFGQFISSAYPAINPTLAAVVILLVCTLTHIYNHSLSGFFQNSLTYVKMGLLLLLCILGIGMVDQPQSLQWVPESSDWSLFVSGGFAVSLIYVSYAYAGWNATTYIAEELENPPKAISRALIQGTLVVLVLYLLLNFTFLYVAPIEELEGKLDFAHIVAQHAFGNTGAQLTSVVLAFLLISTLSSMTLAGPRVLARMGDDFRALSWFSWRTQSHMPIVAITTQSTLALIFILSGQFESILLFSGMAIGISSIATVLAAIWRRMKNSESANYKIPLFPLPPLVFLAITGSACTYAMIEQPLEGAVALALVSSGFVLYLITNYRSSAVTSAVSETKID